MKVADITQGHPTPWAKSFPSWSWVRWFCTRQLDLTLCVTKELQLGRVRGLCLENMQMLYTNHIYGDVWEAQYHPSQILNAEESCAQAG
jgi:hypothetical protein